MGKELVVDRRRGDWKKRVAMGSEEDKGESGTGAMG